MVFWLSFYLDSSVEKQSNVHRLTVPKAVM